MVEIPPIAGDCFWFGASHITSAQYFDRLNRISPLFSMARSWGIRIPHIPHVDPTI